MSGNQKKRFKCETNDNKINKTLINNKIIENSNKLSTNSLNRDTPLHRLLLTTDAKLTITTASFALFKSNFDNECHID
jgi:hypothetical protein